MFKPFKLYRKSQELQLNWIRSHPVKYIAINAILIGVSVGYMEWKDRQDQRKTEEDLQRRIDAWEEIN